MVLIVLPPSDIRVPLKYSLFFSLLLCKTLKGGDFIHLLKSASHSATSELKRVRKNINMLCGNTTYSFVAWTNKQESDPFRDVCRGVKMLVKALFLSTETTPIHTQMYMLHRKDGDLQTFTSCMHTWISCLHLVSPNVSFFTLNVSFSEASVKGLRTRRYATSSPTSLFKDRRKLSSGLDLYVQCRFVKWKVFRNLCSMNKRVGLSDRICCCWYKRQAKWQEAAAHTTDRIGFQKEELSTQRHNRHEVTVFLSFILDSYSYKNITDLYKIGINWSNRNVKSLINKWGGNRESILDPSR